MSKKLLYMLVIMIFVFNFSFVPVALAQWTVFPGDIVINEIMQNPSAVTNGNGEWFEVFNRNGVPIDLQGCVISDGASDSHIIASPLIVPSQGYAVLGRNGNPAQNGGYVPDYVYSGFTLGNGADKIILTCNQAPPVEIDRVEYDGGPNFPDPTGASMMLADVTLDNNVGANWCVSSSAYGLGDLGTPGMPNDTCNGPVCGNGAVEGTEECDDGNLQDGDGCSSQCLIEQTGPYCGDGMVDPGEECDDGNLQDGDGCSSQCILEVPSGPGDVYTDLFPKTGSGTPPIVKVKWEMFGPSFSGSTYVPHAQEGEDFDLTTPGAQFMPPNTWNAFMDYTVCAVATDPDTNGTDEIVGVYADIFYPSITYPGTTLVVPAIHAETPSTDVTDGGIPSLPDYGVGGCGEFIEENTLIKLSKADGYNLFCNEIQTNNNNLPMFTTNYDYAEVCYELDKEEAAVYCDDKKLKWEDPAGDYKVEVFAQDRDGTSAILQNYFEYLPLTSFEVDFTSISYGDVFLGAHKKISGDTIFNQGDGKPTVRNLGNTRLYMHIAQDDMGLGESSSTWNVEYDARVGGNEDDWAIYSPFDFKGVRDPVYPSSDYTRLEDILDLSEEEEMDFSILVKKWPGSATSYDGDMWLQASLAMPRVCTGG